MEVFVQIDHRIKGLEERLGSVLGGGLPVERDVSIGERKLRSVDGDKDGVYEEIGFDDEEFAVALDTHSALIEMDGDPFDLMEFGEDEFLEIRGEDGDAAGAGA